MKRLRAGGATAVVVLAIASANPTETAGQAVSDLAARCVTAGGAARSCAELAVTARALQAHVGLLAGLGSEVSGSAGTLGRRLGTAPRIAVGGRAAFARVSLPDLTDQGGEPSRKTSFLLPALHAGVAVGIFDGFSLAPTVGGLLALDALGNASVVFLPKGEGFDGHATAFSLGARVGLLRESFTLPGVSVSISRRVSGEVVYGDAQAGGRSVQVDPAVTSIRAAVGKDLLSIGVLAGVGWDRYSGDVLVRADAGGTVAEASSSSFGAWRSTIFGGASMNFLILQLSGEVGWAGGFDRVDEYLGAPFDPTSGSLYASLAFRLTI